jgi:hypothetical protein
MRRILRRIVFRDLRLKSLVSILLDHIEYDTFDRRQTRIIPFETLHPAMGALVASVPAVLEAVASCDPNGKHANRLWLLLWCLTSIVHEGDRDDGVATARRQIEQATRNATSEKRKNLQRALDYTLLKPAK